MKITKMTCHSQSPPDHEKGCQPLKYMPKSPVYPPLDDSSENAEFSSILDLGTPREQMSPDKEKPKEPDHGTHMTALADAHTDMDHFDDTDRQDTLKQQLDRDKWSPMAPGCKSTGPRRNGKGCQDCQASI